jgi:molecular chaperone Hsp33
MQTDGPVQMLVVDYATSGQIRACARFDKNRVGEAITANAATPGALLGRGHLAMTIDQGADMSRYQGVVALDGGGLEEAAHESFSRSEQIPTRGPAAEEFAPVRTVNCDEPVASSCNSAEAQACAAPIDPGDAPQRRSSHVS